MTLRANLFQLYKHYADPLNMLRMKLLIIHVAGYNDPALVKELWDSIIDEGEPTSKLCSPFGLPFKVLQENQSRGVDGQSSALEAEIVALSSRFYPSQTAFPLGT